MHCRFIIIAFIIIVMGRGPTLLLLWGEDLLYYCYGERTHFTLGDDPLSVPYACVGIYIHMDVFYEAYLYLHAAIYAECL